LRKTAFALRERLRTLDVDFESLRNVDVHVKAYYVRGAGEENDNIMYVVI
jgi:hypothetical protein